jgi:hypothetical protein
MSLVSVNIAAPQGRVYYIREDTRLADLSQSRILGNELGPLVLNAYTLQFHDREAYIEALSELGTEVLDCYTIDNDGQPPSGCWEVPTCVDGVGIVNETICFNDGGPCVSVEVCSEPPEFYGCWDDFDWGCVAEENPCGGGTLETKTSSSVEIQECTPPDWVTEGARGLRVTRAYLGVSNGGGRMWRTFENVLSIFSDESRLYHTALWLGNERAMGVLLHYGAYKPRWANQSKLFPEGDGANFRPMTVGAFERNYGTMSMRELRVGHPMRVEELWNALREDGQWTLKNYGWRRRNCQHFTDRLSGLLKLELARQSYDDNIEIPTILKPRFRRFK